MTHAVEPGHAATEQQVPGPRVAIEPAEQATAPPAADPGLLALPCFIAGATALGLVLVQFVPAGVAGAAIPIIMTASGVGVLIAAVWAARLGQSPVAGVYGIFAFFWLSYAALVLGLTHNWFGIGPLTLQRTLETFLIAWLVVIGLLTVASVRLPMAFTVLFALVEVALLLDLIGVVNVSSAWTKAAGWFVFAFTALGAYFYLSAMSVATGGRSYPMGRPIVT